MREQVLIVLNERESQKQVAATALTEALTLRRLSSSRLRPGPGLAAIIRERNPEVVVLDYLLGDEGTALDILASLHESADAHEIETIVWTDDPSVSAAVSAMKLGAHDYIEMGGTRNLERLLRAVDSAAAASAARTAARHGAQSRKRSAPPDPVAESPRMREAIAEALASAQQGESVLVVLGESGTGRSTLARYLHTHRSRSGVCIERDLDLWDGTAEHVFSGVERRPPLLDGSATVVLDHAEFDCSGIFSNAAHTWLRGPSRGAMLIVGTSDPATARQWHHITHARVVELPGLTERREDLLSLLQRFTAEAKGFGIHSRIAPTRQLVDAVVELSWPFHLRQLRRCFIDTLARVHDTKRESDAGNEPVETPDSAHDERLRRFIAALKDAQAKYTQYASLSPEVPKKIFAERALRLAGGDERIAALRLGIGIPQLRAAIHGSVWDEQGGAPGDRKSISTEGISS